MNKQIINAPIVIFLGAGASAFLDKPLMKGFVDILLNKTFLDQEEKEIINTIIKTKGKDLETILDEIDEICKKDYFKGPSPRNYFKNLFDKTPSNTLSALLSNLPETQLPSESNFGIQYELLCNKCLSLRWKIYSEIFTTYYSVDEQKVNNLYKPFFDIIKKKLIAEKKKIISIFTTNYDRSIEKFCEIEEGIELTDGFEYKNKYRRMQWTYSSFDELKSAGKILKICFFKLHGSIFWYNDQGSIVYSPIATNFPTDHRIKPVILYPNNTKEIIFDPFITAYSYLQQCFYNTQYIIFIGYSFRDYITITFLKSALRLRNQLKVAIIDPRATNIYKTLFSYYKKNFLCIDKSFTNNVTDYEDSIVKFLDIK
jgi:hypothetical protein